MDFNKAAIQICEQKYWRNHNINLNKAVLLYDLFQDMQVIINQNSISKY